MRPAAASSPAAAAAPERRRIRAATAVFAVATVVSRVAGMVRQVVAAALFGNTATYSAFAVAFQIPNLIRSLVADAALGAAFVPAFTELLELDERERAWRLANTFLALVVVVLGPLTVLAMLFAPQVVSPFFPAGTSPHTLHLAANMARILMPTIMLMGLSGIIVSVLNSYDHFTIPALAPVAWNAVIVAALLLVAPQVAAADRIYVYAWGVLVGTVVQLLLPVPWLRGRDERISFRVAMGDPKVRHVLVLMVPVTISLGIINLQQLIDSAFANHVPRHLLPRGVELASGAAAIENAFRIYMLPQGVFSVAVSTVLFPALARLVVRDDMAGFRDTFADGMRQIFVLLVPSAVFLCVFARPIVRLLYQHGHFTPAHTHIVSGTLVALGTGLVFNGASLLLIRAFFSLRRPWVPTLVSLVILVGNVLLDWLLYSRMGVEGVALATSIVNVVSYLLLYDLLRRRVGALGTVTTVRTVALAAAASAVAVGLAWLALRGVERLLGTSTPALAAAVLVGACIAGAAYLAIIVRLRLVGSQTLLSMVRRRRSQDSPPA